MAARQPTRSSNASHPTPALRAVALCRCSTDRQERSVTDQEAEIKRWCEERGYQLEATFADEAVSGTRLDRPGLNALMAYLARHPEGGVVVAWKLDRVVRPLEIRRGFELEWAIEDAGWSLMAMHGAQPTGDEGLDLIARALEHKQSGDYIKGLAVSVIRGQVSRFQARQCTVGGVIPYGYAKRVVWGDGQEETIPRTARRRVLRPREAHLVPGDPGEIETVRWIFERYLAGCGTKEIAKQLNEAMKPSPAGRSWRQNTVRLLLVNRVYRGDAVLNKRTVGKAARITDGRAEAKPVAESGRDQKNPTEQWIVLPGRHEPLVAPEVFDRAQEEQRGRKGSRRRARQVYPLSGVIFCGRCGSPMAGAPGPRNGREYRCSGYSATGSCVAWRVDATGLEAGILRKMQEVFLPQADMGSLREKVLAALRRRLGDGAAASRGDVARLERELGQLEGKTHQLVENMTMVKGAAARLMAEKLQGLHQRQEVVAKELEEAKAASAGLDLEGAADEVMALVTDLVAAAQETNSEHRRRVFQATVARLEVQVESEPFGQNGRQRHRPTGGSLTPAPIMGVLMETGGRGKGSKVARGVTTKTGGVPQRYLIELTAADLAA